MRQVAPNLEIGPLACRALGAEAEEFHRVVYRCEAGLRGDLFGPALYRAAFDFHAAATGAAGQVVMVGVGAAAAVEGLAVGVPDRVDLAVFAEHLEVAVDGGEADLLATPAQFRID